MSYTVTDNFILTESSSEITVLGSPLKNGWKFCKINLRTFYENNCGYLSANLHFKSLSEVWIPVSLLDGQDNVLGTLLINKGTKDAEALYVNDKADTTRVRAAFDLFLKAANIEASYKESNLLVFNNKIVKKAVDFFPLDIENSHLDLNEWICDDWHPNNIMLGTNSLRISDCLVNEFWAKESISAKIIQFRTVRMVEAVARYLIAEDTIEFKNCTIDTKINSLNARIIKFSNCILTVKPFVEDITVNSLILENTDNVRIPDCDSIKYVKLVNCSGTEIPKNVLDRLYLQRNIQTNNCEIFEI